jgi:hypothetical protein
MRTLSEVLLELSPLSGGEIAQKIREAGVKGVPRRSCHCVIARYLCQETGRERISVCGEDIQVVVDGPTGPRGAEFEETPESVADFIHDFDNNRYPDLISKEG